MEEASGVHPSGSSVAEAVVGEEQTRADLCRAASGSVYVESNSHLYTGSFIKRRPLATHDFIASSLRTKADDRRRFPRWSAFR